MEGIYGKIACDACGAECTERWMGYGLEGAEEHICVGCYDRRMC